MSRLSNKVRKLTRFDMYFQAVVTSVSGRRVNVTIVENGAKLTGIRYIGLLRKGQRCLVWYGSTTPIAMSYDNYGTSTTETPQEKSNLSKTYYHRLIQEQQAVPSGGAAFPTEITLFSSSGSIINTYPIDETGLEGCLWEATGYLNSRVFIPPCEIQGEFVVPQDTKISGASRKATQLNALITTGSNVWLENLSIYADDTQHGIQPDEEFTAVYFYKTLNLKNVDILTKRNDTSDSAYATCLKPQGGNYNVYALHCLLKVDGQTGDTPLWGNQNSMVDASLLFETGMAFENYPDIWRMMIPRGFGGAHVVGDVEYSWGGTDITNNSIGYILQFYNITQDLLNQDIYVYWRVMTGEFNSATHDTTGATKGGCSGICLTNVETLKSEETDNFYRKVPDYSFKDCRTPERPMGIFPNLFTGWHDAAHAYTSNGIETSDGFGGESEFTWDQASDTYLFRCYPYGIFRGAKPSVQREKVWGFADQSYGRIYYALSEPYLYDPIHSNRFNVNCSFEIALVGYDYFDVDDQIWRTTALYWDNMPIAGKTIDAGQYAIPGTYFLDHCIIESIPDGPVIGIAGAVVWMYNTVYSAAQGNVFPASGDFGSWY